MSEEYKDKLRSLSFSKGNRGGTKSTVIRREDNGKPAGRTVEHWDDHVDATAFAPSVKLKAKVTEEG